MGQDIYCSLISRPARLTEPSQTTAGISVPTNSSTQPQTIIRTYMLRVTGSTALHAIEIQLNGGVCLVKTPDSSTMSWAWKLLSTAGGYINGTRHPRAVGATTTSFTEGTWCTVSVLISRTEVSVWTRDGLVLYVGNLTLVPAAPTVFDVKLSATNGLPALSAMVTLKSIRRWP